MENESEDKWKCEIEVFCKDIDGWISFTLEEMYELLSKYDKEINSNTSQTQTSFMINNYFTMFNICNNSNTKYINEEAMITPNNYYEFKTQYRAGITLDATSQEIKTSPQIVPTTYNVWLRGKAVFTKHPITILHSHNNSYSINTSSSNTLRHIHAQLPCNHASYSYIRVFNNVSLSLYTEVFLPFLISLPFPIPFHFQYNNNTSSLYVHSTSLSVFDFINETIQLCSTRLNDMTQLTNQCDEEKATLEKLSSIMSLDHKRVLYFHKQFEEVIKTKLNEHSEIKHVLFKRNCVDDKTLSLVLYGTNNEEVDEYERLFGYVQETIKIDKEELKEVETIVRKVGVNGWVGDEEKEELYIIGYQKEIDVFKKVFAVRRRYLNRIKDKEHEKEDALKELSEMKEQFNLK